MKYLALAIIFVLSYLIGNINFARIFSWAFAKKDITTVGSHNPGTMNMLRTRGFGEAILTLIMEAIKSGLPAIISYYVIGYFYPGFENITFFIAGFGAILGHCFPVFYKFVGGKGVACTFGMFTFHPTLWWISLVAFVVCFLLMLFVIKYGSVISFIYILAMSITATCLFTINAQDIMYVIPVLVVIWLNVILIFSLHHANIKRLFTGKEGKIDLMSKLKKKKQTVEVEEGDDKTGEEIVVEPENTQSVDNENKQEENKNWQKKSL